MVGVEKGTPLVMSDRDKAPVRLRWARLKFMIIEEAERHLCTAPIAGQIYGYRKDRLIRRWLLDLLCAVGRAYRRPARTASSRAAVHGAAWELAALRVFSHCSAAPATSAAGAVKSSGTGSPASRSRAWCMK
jgi:hypothetical protein